MDFTLSNFESHPTLQLVDEDKETGLRLYTYTNCDNSSSSFVKKCRGVIVQTETNKVLTFFGYTDVVTPEELVEQKRFKPNSQTFYKSYEGTLLRLFYYHNKWRLSTNNKLNAYKSYWGRSYKSKNESFGVIFNRCLLEQETTNNSYASRLDFKKHQHPFDRLTSLLDKEKQYAFLVCSNAQTHMVCTPKPNQMFYVGTFKDNKLVSNDVLNLPEPETLTFNTEQEMVKYVDNTDYKQHQGVICYNEDGTQWKCMNRTYTTFEKLRGNTYNPLLSFLEHRLDVKNKELVQSLYPTYKNAFSSIESVIEKVVKKNFEVYTKRFLKHEYSTTSPIEYEEIVKKCLDKQKDGTSVDEKTVRSIVDTLSVETLYSIVQMYEDKEPRQLAEIAQYNFDVYCKRFIHNQFASTSVFEYKNIIVPLMEIKDTVTLDHVQKIVHDMSTDLKSELIRLYNKKLKLIRTISERNHHVYVTRFVDGNYSQTSPIEYHNIIKPLMQKFNREPIQLMDVIQHVKTLDHSILTKINKAQ